MTHSEKRAGHDGSKSSTCDCKNRPQMSGIPLGVSSLRQHQDIDLFQIKQQPWPQGVASNGQRQSKETVSSTKTYPKDRRANAP